MIRFMIAVLLAIFLVNPISRIEAGHHRVIIHIPYQVKTIKHTHTITKVIHHSDDEDKEKILDHPYEKPNIVIHNSWGGAGIHREGTEDQEYWLPADEYSRMSFGDELGGATFEEYA